MSRFGGVPERINALLARHVAMVLVVVMMVIVVALLNEPGWTPCGTPQALELERFGSTVGSHRAHSLLKRLSSDNNHSTGS
jgi:hypothetical protein